MNATAPIGLLVKRFPKLSETFVLEEVLGLERLGVPLRIYALEAPSDPVAHPAVARVKAPVTQLPARLRDDAWRLASRHAALFAQAPLRYLGALRDAARRGSTGLRDFARAGWLAGQLREDGVAHLHTHFISRPADVAEIVSRVAAIPFSISAHAKDIYLSAAADLRRKLGAARFTVTCTEFNSRTLRAIAPAARVQRMYHGIDHAAFHPGCRCEGGPVANILSVGRLVEKKGMDTLVHACALLRARGVPLHCTIVGYGEEEKRLAALVEDLGLQTHVTLAGRLPREQVIGHYAQASVYVQASRIAADGDRDGIPNVLLEAMAIGVPVVATRVSGIPELVRDRHTGLLVDPDDPAALADAIAALIEDPALGRSLAQAGRATVLDGFDNDRNLRQLVALLHGGEQTPVQVAARAERRAAPKPAHASPGTGLALRPSKPAQAGLEPRPSFPSGDRPTYPSAEGPTFAYVMNGFPRLSETFIANEIHQLERLGLSLRLFSVKREGEPKVHPVVAAIRAPLTYLPEATSLSGASLAGWLQDNLGAFWRAHALVASRHPLRWLSALGTALGLAWEHRGTDERGHTRLRKVFVKEFLQAGEIAAAVLRARDVAHLHGHFCHGVATITWLAARMTGLPFSFTAHAKDIYQAELNPGDLLERKLGAARFVATCTCANATVLRGRHPRPCEVHAIYHGLDTEFFAPPKQPVAAEPGAAPLILAVGRFVEKKGFDQLVEACAMLRDAGVRFECRIVGEKGSAYEPLLALIEARGLQQIVKPMSAVTQDELRGIYARARLFALPCQVMDDGDRDGFPNVLAESMAMGVPVVTTSISGIPELIDDGVHGLLVEPRGPVALAGALRRVLQDDALHARLARDGRARICERFDSRRTTVELRDLFLAQLPQGGVAAQPVEARA